MTTTLQDVRYAARVLRQSPAFLVTTVVTLAVGLALITVVFTAFSAYVLRPYAVRSAQTLHRVAWVSDDSWGITFRWREYEAISGRQDLLDGAVAQDIQLLTSSGRALVSALVSDNYFETLSPPLAAGRGLAGFDAATGAAVLSHAAWQRLYAGAPDVVGRQVDVSGRPFTIVGVLGPEFVGLGDTPADVWLPFRAYAAMFKPDLLGPQQPRTVEVMGWLRHGVSIQQAEASLTATLGFVVPDTGAPAPRADLWSESTPLPLDRDVLLAATPVFVAFGLVLATACANVSSVMLARAVARRREIAVRLSLGASRGRIIRQLMTEGLLIALLAAMTALALAHWSLRAGTVLLFSTMPPSFADVIRLAPMSIDLRVFAFALAVAAAATLLFALIPAIQASRLSLVGMLRGVGAAGTGRSRLRNVLVVGQVTVAMILVIAAFTFARGGAALGSVEIGVDTDDVFSITARGDANAFLPKVVQLLNNEPRIARFAVTSRNPFKGAIADRRVAVVPSGSTLVTPTPVTLTSPDYFDVLGMPIDRGRIFTPAEAGAAAPVAIVSAATGRALWPGQNPIGQTFRLERADGPTLRELRYSVITVVGTTRDVVSGYLMDGPDPGHIYLPIAVGHPSARSVLLRGRSDRDLSLAVLQDVLSRAAPDAQAFETLAVDELLAIQRYPLQIASAAGTLLGAIALVLSAAGLYGVLTYTVSQRTREIGIRMAIGATASAVMGLVLKQSLRLSGVGAAIGLALAFAAMQTLNSMVRMPNFSLVDLTAFGGGAAVVLVAAATAAFNPAWRAARVDPAVTLRADA